MTAHSAAKDSAAPKMDLEALNISSAQSLQSSSSSIRHNGTGKGSGVPGVDWGHLGRKGWTSLSEHGL
jgi:hypothetical protein